MKKKQTTTMNGHKLRKLISDYNDAYNDAYYAEYMLDKTKSEKKREELEDELNYYEETYLYIAEKIKELKPSKYLIKKYEVELEDIFRNI